VDPDPDPGQLITDTPTPAPDLDPKHLLYSYYKILGSLTFPTGGTLGGKDAVEVVDTVDLVVKVHREGNPVQAVVAHAASEHNNLIFSLPISEIYS
jgi:hypothetical protein